MRAIGKFIVLTFASTWLLWWLVIRASGPHVPAALALGGPVFLLGVFAPGFVAVGLTAWDEGQDALLSLLARLVRWRVRAGFWAFALLLMPVTKLVVAGLHYALTGDMAIVRRHASHRARCSDDAPSPSRSTCFR